jgi:hypothetical protein
VKPPDDSTRAAELKAMQDSIYREKILRARRQTPEERLADVFELSNTVLQRMHDGAMWQMELTDEQEGWDIVRQRLARLRQLHEAGRFTNEPPAPRP